MGLFSSKKIINVSSTLYNMAGPEEDRPNYLKGTLFSSIMANSPSVSDDITNSYFSGPGMKQRLFFNYANRQDLAGLPTVTVANNEPVDAAVVANEIPVPADPAGMKVVVQSSYISEGDPEVFIERWILQNHSTRLDENWLGEYKTDGTFSVQFPNGDYYEFTDPEFKKDARYVQANFFHVLEDNTQPLEEGTPTSVTSLPDVTGWDAVSSSGTFTNTTLVRSADVTESYSDGRPDENYVEDASVADTLNTSVDVYERTSWVGIAGFETEGLYERYTFTGTDSKIGGYEDTIVTQEDIGGGVTKTTTKVITGEQKSVSWDSQLDTQTIYEDSVIGGEQMFIYEIGTGNANLDALANNADASNFQEFYPFLPIRLDNVSVKDTQYTSNGLYDETRKAYRKLTTENIDKIIDNVEANESIGDIDYAYVMFGCSLNVQENACRKYIFNFFDNMIQFQQTNGNTMSDFQAQIAAYEQAKADLAAWQSVHEESIAWYEREPPPTIPNLSIPPTTTLKLKTDSPLMPSYDIRLIWTHIENEQVEGTYTFTDPLGSTRPANVGECMFEDGAEITWTETLGTQIRDDIEYRTVHKSIPSIVLYNQISATHYRKLTIHGLIHQNHIYGGKYVEITSKEALADNDISGFVVPLHFPTMKAMSIVDYTQMATANVHILFNSYTVTKQKWYQRGIFKIILVVVAIVIAVIIFPGAFAAGGGILGSNLAVGAALGLTGTAALVAGVVANYLASMIISQLLSAVGTAIFGEKWGAVFAAIASFAMGAAVSGLDMFSAEGILSLANAGANAYSGWVQGDIAEMQGDYQEDFKAYEKKMDYINDLIAGLGGNDLNFDPLSLTDSSYGNGSRSGSSGYLPETADEFIRRTLMTGSDVVEITHAMVYDFVAVQQTLPRN
jgi:hypothetical protein